MLVVHFTYKMKPQIVLNRSSQMHLRFCLSERWGSTISTGEKRDRLMETILIWTDQPHSIALSKSSRWKHNPVPPCLNTLSVEIIDESYLKPFLVYPYTGCHLRLESDTVGADEYKRTDPHVCFWLFRNDMDHWITEHVGVQTRTALSNVWRVLENRCNPFQFLNTCLQTISSIRLQKATLLLELHPQPFKLHSNRAVLFYHGKSIRKR